MTGPALTIEAWIRPTAANQTATVLTAKGTETGWSLELDAGQVVWWTAAPDRTWTVVRANPIPLRAGTWYHVAVTVDQDRARVLVNGNAGPATTIGALTAGPDVRLGGYPDKPFFAGQIDEVRISSVVRYPAAFRLPTAAFTPDTHTLALYHLDEGVGQTAADDSGNGYTLTLGGAATGDAADPAWRTATTPITGRTDLQRGLIAAYAFAEGAGATTADSSGHGHTGAISGATWTSAGQTGPALVFDGVDDWVTVNDSPTLAVTTDLTVMGWVKPTALGGWRTIVFKEQPNDFVYALDADADGAAPAGYVYAGGQVEARGTEPLALNTWTHVALTYDGVDLILYVDGIPVQVQAASGALPASDGAVRIGGNAPWGEFFQGTIDELRIYARALSPTAIQAARTTPVGAEATADADATDTRSISYRYDGLDRLTGADESGSTTNSYTYGYDLAGNRTSVTVNGTMTTYAYNAANQVTNSGYRYDAA
ncbi:MAG: LamG domain-containing protein, partial [Chloroflexales bacterium]|nr:LamG domain-containing protein [Chloroflexales bacterium]